MLRAGPVARESGRDFTDLIHGARFMTEIMVFYAGLDELNEDSTSPDRDISSDD